MQIILLIKIILREGLIVIGLFGYLLYLNWKLSIVLLLTGPFIAAIVYFAGKRLRRISTRLQNAMGDITHVSSESINANKEIKLFGQQETEFSKFVKMIKEALNIREERITTFTTKDLF